MPYVTTPVFNVVLGCEFIGLNKYPLLSLFILVFQNLAYNYAPGIIHLFWIAHLFLDITAKQEISPMPSQQ